MSNESSDHSPRFIERKGSAIGAGLTAAMVTAAVIAAIFWIPDLTGSQRGLFRFLIAIGAGAFATFFLGGVAMEGTVGNFRIAAGGGFALFLIMLLVVDPLPKEPVDNPRQASNEPVTRNVTPTDTGSGQGRAGPAAQAVATPRYEGYRDAPGSESATGLTRLYARAVARLAIDGSPRCTAFLVSENLALTASFCVPDDGGAISLQFDDAGPSVGARLIESSGAVGANRISYAILKLERNVGAERGWLPLTSTAPSVGTPLRVIGGALLRDIKECVVTKLETNEIEHDCDPGKGGAGAPILAADASRVVGIYAYRDRSDGRRSAVRADVLLKRSAQLESLARP